MTTRAQDIAWEPIAQLMGQSESGLKQTFPPSLRRLSILEALQEKTVACSLAAAQPAHDLAQRLSGLLEQLRVFDSISRCPIVAVTGLLNAGKSSLLATYLSPSNRPRVLRGVGNYSGTHRFVVWLPKIWWEDPNLLNTLIAFMTQLFGHPPERLADDPAQAAEQYNGQVVLDEVMLQAGSTRTDSAASRPDPMSIPLIAYDEQLNQLQLGLVDCPDIQTGFVTLGERALTPADVAALRQSHLARIGRLCSAFLVVSKLNSLHDEGLLQILTTLRDAMPGVPRMLAINKIKARYAPATVLDEARGLVERFGLEAVYGAYDYRSSLAESRVLPPPPNMPMSDEPQPIFVELGSKADTRSTPRYLYNLGERLDAGQLSQASNRSLRMQLLSLTSLAVEWLETNQQQRQQQIRDAWQAVAHACYEFMAEHDIHGRATGLRLQASPAIIVQMADSLQRTAPTWMRISLSIDRTARQLQQAISNSAARFTILKNASESVTQFTKKFRRGEGAQVMTPERLAKSIQQSDRHASLESVPSEKLISDCGHAMQRFAQENQTLLDEHELHRWSEQVWKDMSWRDKLWKGTQPLAVIMAPLLAVVLLPFDGGGTAVLVFASAKELLAAAGLAALLGPAATGGEALSIIQRETPWRQLSDLFAICCDAVGLPRPQSVAEMPQVQCAGQPRPLLLSQIETKLGPPPPAVTQWQLPDQTLHTLRGLARG